jgi:penicillin-binding protein 1A
MIWLHSIGKSWRRVTSLSIVRKAGLAATALIFLGAVALTALLLSTPSVENADALARAQARQHRIPYPGPRLPQRFVKALIATEDHRFYSPLNPGIDPFAVARVAVATLELPHRDPGGSTIAQQLAKMLYTPGQHGFAVKLEHVGLAIKLHFAYSPAQILAMYAEVAYFGDGYYGLAAASCGYFGHPPAELTWPQAATLAGVVNAPALDDPRKNPQRAKARESHVLRRLVAVGDLTQEQAAAALAEPLGTVERNPKQQQACESARSLGPLSMRH